jgi:hypothetical protein
MAKSRVGQQLFEGCGGARPVTGLALPVGQVVANGKSARLVRA